MRAGSSARAKASRPAEPPRPATSCRLPVPAEKRPAEPPRPAASCPLPANRSAGGRADRGAARRVLNHRDVRGRVEHNSIVEANDRRSSSRAQERKARALRDPTKLRRRPWAAGRLADRCGAARLAGTTQLPAVFRLGLELRLGID
jgi:hypothetical protein